MLPLEEWYKKRRQGRLVPQPQNDQDYSCEITEKVEGGLRTTTFFPRRAFLSGEEQEEIARQIQENF